MTNCISKAAICYEKVIFPELCYKTIYNDIEVERNVKEVVSYLLDQCEIIDDNMDIDFEINQLAFLSILQVYLSLFY